VKEIPATRVIASEATPSRCFSGKQSPPPAGSIRSAKLTKKVHKFGGLASALCHCPRNLVPPFLFLKWGDHRGAYSFRIENKKSDFNSQGLL